MAALDEWMDFSCAYFRAFLLEVMTYQPSSYSILWPRRLAEVSGMTSSSVWVWEDSTEDVRGVGSNAHPDHARPHMRGKIIAVDVLNSNKARSSDRE